MALITEEIKVAPPTISRTTFYNNFLAKYATVSNRLISIFFRQNSTYSIMKTKKFIDRWNLMNCFTTDCIMFYPISFGETL